MEPKNLRILLLMFQPSVVARGLEKKLVEMGNMVETIVGDFTQLELILDDTDLVIFNLPQRLDEDAKELKALVHIGEILDNKDKKMIFVGERQLWEDLGKVYAGTSKYIWVYRPINEDDLFAAMEKTMTQVKVHGEKPRILIVDDDPSYARMVREWIKDFYKVDIVTAGMQAISFLVKLPKKEGVDLILLDYEMPIVDVPQVFQMLRSDSATSAIPVVFLTGVGSREGVTRVMSLKPDGYILKSTPKEELLEFLEKKLGC